MEKKRTALRLLIIAILKKRIVQVSGTIIIIILILLWPIQKAIEYKSSNSEKDKETVELNDTNNAMTKGTINTDVQRGDSLESENISRYDLGDGFSEIEDIVSIRPSSSSSSSSSSTSTYVDFSALNGSNLTIFEGETFEPVKDLKLSATDKDGADISNKIVVEESDVNTEKPGTYMVRVSVKLNNGQRLQRTFAVEVKPTNLELVVESFEPQERNVKKGEDILLNLDIKSSKSHVKVSGVGINGKEYSVYKSNINLFSALSNTQKYKVKLNADNIAGNKEYKLSYIRMSDNTIISTDNIATLEVMKSEPVVKDFKYESMVAAKKVSFSFSLEDIDNSASNLVMEIYKDKELINSKNLDKKAFYEESFSTMTNGLYEIKILADVNLNSSADVKNIISNKELLSESIKATSIDESDLTGNDVEIIEGEELDIEELNIKATDVNGDDITDKVVIDASEVNTDVAGTYTVAAHVINRNNRKIEKTFNVIVANEDEAVDQVESVTEENFEINTISMFSLDSEEESYTENQKVRAITRDTVSGNDTETLNAPVKVTGTVKKSDGTAPNGRLEVELPTSLVFSVDKNGQLQGGVFTVKNNSATDIVVSVGQFQETKIGDGITIKPLTEDLTNQDRSNIHLYLRGDSQVDLGEKINPDQVLTTVSASNSKTIQLLGDAGKTSGQKVDADGASEEFMLVFKIKKKS